ncbi:helix-turn-helix domain-containing protein [Actinomadura nitritigenes]|uniref:helix-turn-helix domain-containing protein n=1 Tax=Actinomadura nitritigenes TaxID=134602 RepID=UPI003D904D0F
MVDYSPTVRVRRLAALLRELRESSGRTASDVARELGWSLTKLTRMEDRRMRKPQAREVGKLLDVYRVGQEKRAEVMELVRQARDRGWWHNYQDAVDDPYVTYVGLEAEAVRVQNYEPSTIPGLLQTREYARALLRARATGLGESLLEERVELRMERQKRLLGELDLWAIVTEEMLSRRVGGREVMAAQLEHLLDVAQHGNVSLQVLPVDAGAAPACGPFVILRFADDLDPEVVYAETAVGDVYVEKREEVESFMLSFERLIAESLAFGDSLALIARRAAEIRRTG